MLCLRILIFLPFLIGSLNSQVEARVIVTPVVLTSTSDTISIQALYYNSNKNLLLYTDTEQKTIHIYDVNTLLDRVLQIDQRATVIIPIRGEDFSFIVTFDRDIAVLYWDYSAAPSNSTVYTTYFTCLLTTVDGRCHGNRWNTGTVDAYGNIWLGSLTILDPFLCDCPPNMYRALTTKSGLLTADIAVQNFYSNGIVFTVDYRIMYTIDYYNRQVLSFNFDLPREIICCPKVVFRYDDFDLNGVPDSITKDNLGNLWIGSFNGSQVININPTTGALLDTVEIPARLVTTVTFGGLDLRTMFVGTMQSDDPLDPLGGSLFAVTGLDVSGVPEDEAVVNSFCRPFYF